MSAQRRKLVDFAAEGLRLALLPIATAESGFNTDRAGVPLHWEFEAFLVAAFGQEVVLVGCSKAANWSPLFSSLSPLRRAFARRLPEGRL
jgi:hypothetical protein